MVKYKEFEKSMELEDVSNPHRCELCSDEYEDVTYYS